MRRLRFIATSCLLLLALGCGGGGGGAAPAATAFVVHDPAAGFAPPPIVLQHDPAAGLGHDWETALARAMTGNNRVFARDPEMLAWSAATYLQEGIRAMTGRSLPVSSGTGLGRGIVFLTLAGAPAALRDDPAVAEALRIEPEDPYAHTEAFYIRTSPERVLILAHGAAGWVNAAVALLESVDYEVLGMGPRWVHTPDRADGLVLDLERAERPSWYLREPAATSGQYYGVGTIFDTTRTPLTDPADETVHESYWRWRVGTRTWGRSMPPFPGHALQARHAEVLERMRADEDAEGFLAPTSLGLEAARPSAADAGAGQLWVNTDPVGAPGHGGVFLSDGASWTAYDPALLPVSLDLTVPRVRAVLLDDLEARADAWFAGNPDMAFVYGTDPEDGGGYAAFAAHAAHPTWYPDYRAGIGEPLGGAYPLHGRFGIDQPLEGYDPASPCDCVYACNDWLLREYDARLAARPPSERVTSTGRAKGALVRTSFLSYNFHDVPPRFVPDPRMRVMIAGYPKTRGRDPWQGIVTSTDVAAALRVLLPDEPPAVYSIWSLAWYQDQGIEGVEPERSSQAASLQPGFAAMHAAGVRGYACEVDFNFGKHALGYYLLPRMLWNARLDVQAVDALRDRWIRRAFGSAFEPMKAYYELLTPEGWFANTETVWATAVAYLEAADAAIDPALEPDAQARLDDVKQMWWWHWLTVQDRLDPADPAVRTFLWKGQTAYQVAMHVVSRGIFGETWLHDALAPAERDGPARYTPEETAAWWSIVRDAWTRAPVTLFEDVTLADGTPGGDVDVNDLVWTQELVAAGGRIGIDRDRTYWFNSGYQMPVTLLVSARQGEAVGFTMAWTEVIARAPTCGIDRWDTTLQAWESLVDPAANQVEPVLAPLAFPAATGYLAEYALAAPQDGTYRVRVGRGGNFTQITGAGYDFSTGTYDRLRPCTYFDSQDGLTQYDAQPMCFAYIPRGVPSLDVELLVDVGGTAKLFTRGVVTGAPYTSRTVTLGSRGTQVIPLEADEDGGIVAFTWIGFEFPVLYSVPQRWARSPTALLVPRAVAAADGLTIR